MSTEPRKPVAHVPGVDTNPPGLTELERAAAERPGERDIVQVLHEAAVAAMGAHEPLVPKHWVPIVLGIGALLLGSSTVAPGFFPDLPQWVPFTGATLALIAFYLGGQSAPDFAPGRPLVPLALVPVCLTATTALTAAASQATDARVQGALLAAAAVTAWLAGKATPQPLRGHG